MRRLLLTVEWAGPAGRDLGAALLPHQSYRTLPDPPPTTVTVELPDGSARAVDAGYGQAHINYGYAAREHREPWMAICYLKGLAPAEVPAGSRVWYDDGLPPEDAGAEGYEEQRT
jgi:hypothetical protein